MRINEINLTNFVTDMGILMCANTSLDFVNISASVISWTLILRYNGQGWQGQSVINTFFSLVLHSYQELSLFVVYFLPWLQSQPDGCQDQQCSEPVSRPGHSQRSSVHHTEHDRLRGCLTAAALIPPE